MDPPHFSKKTKDFLKRKQHPLIQSLQQATHTMNERSRSAFLSAQLESLRQERFFWATFRPLTDLHPWVLGAAEDVSARYGRCTDLDVLVLDDTPVPIDEQHFSCLIRELLDNAFRYLGQGTPVQIARLNLGCAHRLMIRDEGKGMDADYIHTLNSGAPLPRDTVSGHYVVRKVLSMYRSTFFVWSQVDAGACFEIDFLR